MGRNVAHATPASTWQLAQTEEGRQAILRQYDQDTHTAAGHGVRAALMNTWDNIHHLWAPCEPVLPLTPSKIRNVAAHMKHAGYRSWSNYASRIREAHINAGFIISPQLELAFRAARRSVLRGIGPSRQAMSLDLAAAAALENDDVIITRAMPIAGVSVFIMAAFFLLREIEMAALCFCHVVTDKAKECVTLELSISKADPDARGCRRAWGCLCGGDPTVPCPYHAWLLVLAAFTSAFGQPRDEDPVFPNAARRPCTKTGVVDLFRAIAGALQAVAKRGQGAIGGHTARVSGARFLAGIGLELALIQLLARWASGVIVDYVRDAPLIALTGTAKRMMHMAHERGASVVQSWRDDAIRKQLAGIETRLAAIATDHTRLGAVHTLDLDKHEDVIVDMGTATVAAEFVGILSHKYKRLHLSRVSPSAVADPTLLRTRGCSWKFGLSRYTVVHASTEAKRCPACWRGLSDQQVPTDDSE